MFPRFEAVDFAGSRRAILPSKLAYTLFSTVLSLLVGAATVVVDDAARELAAVLLSAWLPFGISVGTSTVAVLDWVVLATGIVSIPLAYGTAVRRVEAYRL